MTGFRGRHTEQKSIISHKQDFLCVKHACTPDDERGWKIDQDEGKNLNIWENTAQRILQKAISRFHKVWK